MNVKLIKNIKKTNKQKTTSPSKLVENGMPSDKNKVSLTLNTEGKQMQSKTK